MHPNETSIEDALTSQMVDLDLVTLAIPTTGTIEFSVVFYGDAVHGAESTSGVAVNAAANTLRDLMIADGGVDWSDDAIWRSIKFVDIYPSATMKVNFSAGTSVPAVTTVPAGGCLRVP